MVAGVGTILIDPPEGDMARLPRAARRGCATCRSARSTPRTAPPIPDGPAKLDEYLAHRAMREAKLLAAIPASGATLDEVVMRGYDDVASVAYPLAERSSVAILEKLEREGRVRLDGEQYFTR